jgi:hypothetical protein
MCALHSLEIFTMWIRFCALRLICLLLLFSCSVAAAAKTAPDASDRLAATLSAAAPSADSEVIKLATHALSCMHRRGGGNERMLGVIDYSRPSTEQRLWVFDLREEKLLFQEWVAHGRNTGDNYAEHFSNRPGSLMSSLGGFEAAGTYMGQNGYSLRLQGLEPGFNDRAYERAIVIHGAPYVSENLIRTQGRLGRSFGCPAVRPEIAHRLIDALNESSFVFAYYPDPQWLSTSPLLGDCDATSAFKKQEAASTTVVVR